MSEWSARFELNHYHVRAGAYEIRALDKDTAYLIAAAPEMLEALEDARRLIADLPIDAMGAGETTITGPDGEASLMRWPIRDELLDKVNAAIAKARRTL